MFIYFNRSNRGTRNFSTLTHHSSSIWTMSSSEHCRRDIFQIYNVQNLKITRITTFRICNVVYQAGSRWDPKCVFNFLHFIIFILNWCGTHTKIRSKLVDIVTAGSQKITLWGPQRTPLGILRFKQPVGIVRARDIVLMRISGVSAHVFCLLLLARISCLC